MLMSNSSAIPFPPSTPLKIPASPPSSDSTIASSRNWRTMSSRRAPIAFRKPISRVRSVTLTSMMFMMPMPAASSAITLTTNAPIFTCPAI